MKKRVLSLFMALALCLTLLPTAALAEETAEYGAVNEPAVQAGGSQIATQAGSATGIWVDGVNQNGELEKGNQAWNGICVDGTMDTWGNDIYPFYIVQKDQNVTIQNLTINGDIYLILCDNATLTVEGSLILNCQNFTIYGQTESLDPEDSGVLSIKSASTAIKSNYSDGNGSGTTISLRGGKLTATSASGVLAENVYLTTGNSSIQKCSIDGENKLPEDWVRHTFTKLEGRSLTIEYCEHDHATYVSASESTHKTHCTDCGFVGAAKACGSDGTAGFVSAGKDGHYKKCHCGNPFGDLLTHDTATVPTDNGQKHTSGCGFCGWTSDGNGDEHDFSEGNGSCKDCGITPIMRDSDGDLYDKENYEKAFEKAADSNGTVTLTLVSKVTGEGANIWTKSIEFNYPGKSVTLDMGGITLSSTGEAALTVNGGTLIIENAATLEGEEGIAGNTPYSAIKVTGGSLTFNGTVNATGGNGSSSAAPAIEVTGGKVTFEGAVTATGGSSDNEAASAIEVSGGAATFKGTVTAKAQIINTTDEVVLSPAINVSGGTVTFEKKLTATGGGNNAGGNKPEQQPAVYATNGTLDFQDDLDLNGGLTITGDATLRTLLSTGTFTAMPSSDAKRVSVVGSKNYTYLRDLLEDGYVFFAEGSNRYLVFSDTDWSGDTTIKAHTHIWEKPASGDIYECSICKQSCAHEGGYKTGKCEVCGKPCPHDMADAVNNYRCNECGKQMVARIQTDTWKWAHYPDLVTALNAATDGQTVTLLTDAPLTDDVYLYSTTVTTAEDMVVTLDLNRHNVTASGWASFILGEGAYDWNNPSAQERGPFKLAICGTGNVEPGIRVNVWASLDLSGWTGGTINMISMQDNSNYDAATREPALVVGKNAGTIAYLGYGNNQLGELKKNKLSGGKYSELWIADHGGVRLGDLLADGFAFQKADGSYVNYAEKFQNTTLTNLTVVECPHDDAENGRCLYCNEDGIAATVDGIFYDLDHVNHAIAAWLATNGSTLKLFTDASTDELDLSSAAADSLTIDLNGHSFTKNGDAVKLNGGKRLTIKDSKGENKGVFGPVLADSGKLTLESGCLKGLNIPSSSTAQIILNGGKVSAISCPIPIYNLLPNGYALMKDDVPVNPAEILTDNTATYTVKYSDITLTQPGDPITISYGQNTLPFAFALETYDQNVAKVKFTWYLVNEDSTTTELTSTGNVAAAENGVYTYDTTTTGTDTLSSLTPGEYKAICVVSGLDVDGNCLWMAPFTNRKFTVEKAGLADAVITFNNRSNRITFNPFGDTTATPDVDFTVTCYGKTLKYGEDYTVSGNATKNGVGYYDLTISAVPTNSNYTGTKKVRWEVEEYILSHLALSSATITKKYDGTADLPAGSVTSNFISRDESVKDLIPLQLGTDYTLGETSYKVFDETANNYVDSPNAGSGKTVYCEVTLLSKDYRAGYGGKQLDWYFYASEVNASITKADAPAFNKVVTFDQIVNDLEATYTIDLPTLPELQSPKTYGDIAYTVASLSLDHDYAALGEPKIVQVNGKYQLHLTVPAVKYDKETPIGTIMVKVKTTNYEDVILTVNLKSVNKLQPTVIVTAEPDTITYGTTLADITLTATATHEGSSVPGAIAWDDPDTKPNAGDHEVEWTFMPADTEHYRAVSGMVSIHVDKATPTGEPNYTAIKTSGKKLADAGLAANESWPAGTLQWVDKDGRVLDPAATEVKANTAYHWKFTPDGNNYNAIEGSITLYHYSADIPAAPTYPVNTPDGTANGSVSISPKNASKGSTVTITVKPDSGYQLGDLTVTDKDGNVLEITDKGNGKYTFVMPDGKADIRVSFTEQTEESPFRDVSTGAYYYDAVKWAVGKDITTGIGGGLFGPNQSCTRAQIVTFLWRAAGSPEPTALSSFTDVAPTAYYAKAVAWAVENGVTTGTSETEFSPNEPCTRAQAVTFLYRALKAAASGSSTAFSDVAADAYYASAVAWAVENGVTTGVGDGLFAPKDTCTRAQIVTFLYRAYQGK